MNVSLFSALKFCWEKLICGLFFINEKIPKSTFLSQNFICTEIPLELLLVQNYYSGQRIQILYLFALTRFHKHKKTYFFVRNQSSIYTFYTHKRVKKKFSLFFRQKMRTFDPHFRHSFLHLKRIEEVRQCP